MCFVKGVTCDAQLTYYNLVVEGGNWGPEIVNLKGVKRGSYCQDCNITWETFCVGKNL